MELMAHMDMGMDIRPHHQWTTSKTVKAKVKNYTGFAYCAVKFRLTSSSFPDQRRWKTKKGSCLGDSSSLADMFVDQLQLQLQAASEAGRVGQQEELSFTDHMQICSGQPLRRQSLRPSTLARSRGLTALR